MTQGNSPLVGTQGTLDPELRAKLDARRKEIENAAENERQRKLAEARKKMPVSDFALGTHVIKIIECTRLERTKYGARTVCVYIDEATAEIRKTFLPAAAYRDMKDARAGDRWIVEYKGKLPDPTKPDRLIHDIVAIRA